MRTILTLVALFVFVTPAQSECLACWSLEEVQIKLRSGEKLSGYLPWNDGWVFINRERFGLVEAITSKDPAVRSELSKLNLHMYPELLELTFEPFVGKRIAIKQPIRIDCDQIASIMISSGPHTGYSGAGLIELVDAAGALTLLKAHRPRYTIEPSAELGDSYYAVYGESVTPRALLWHVARMEQGPNEPRIKVNGAPLFGGQTAGPFHSVDDVLSGVLSEHEIRQFREFPDEFHSYIRKRDYASAPCRNERDALSKRWRSLAKDDPSYSQVQSEFRAILAKCNQIERAVLDQYPPSLGDKAKLSSLGIIQLSFAWD